MGFLRSLMSVVSTDGKTGTPFKLDKHTLYWKGNGVTELDAAHVAGFFKGYGYFPEGGASAAQISAAKPTDPLKVSFFFGKEADPNILHYFINMANQLQQFFPGRQITASLIDSDFKELKNLGLISDNTVAGSLENAGTFQASIAVK
jgi:hypothetical protein